jgi:hypothetical protein
MHSHGLGTPLETASGVVYSQQMPYRRNFGNPSSEQTSGGFVAVGIFLFFGATMAALAGTTLVWPATSLDKIWLLNPRARHQLAAFGNAIGFPFLILAAIMALAGVGWFRRRLWAWRLSIAIIATQVLGDLVNCLRGDLVPGAVGFAISGTLLFYLLRPKLRDCFRARPGP